MNEPFGPWSSAPGDGLSPHLSTFWKQRLALLSPARAARLGLSRRDWLKLGAAGAAACALPTLHLATAEDAEPAAAGNIYLAVARKSNTGDDLLAAVFALDPETGTHHEVNDFGGNVRVSRDGRTLALIGYGTEAKDSGVWTLGADGKGEKRRITDFAGVVSWSPDGEQLIVTKLVSNIEDEALRIENWRFSADGSDATKLPIPETDEVDDWSSDGQWLVTSSDRHPPLGRGYQIYLMRPDGTGQRRLTEGKGLNVYPRFSPDGRRVAYLHSEGGKNSVWIVDIDGGARRRVLEEEKDASPYQLCWSPDGKSLAYTIRYLKRDENSRRFVDGSGIAILDVEGKRRRSLNLPRAQWLSAPDWR